MISSFDVSVLVDPARTRNHKVWTSLEGLTEIEHADIVFFVDLMFAPMSFDAEAKALVAFANQNDDKRFFVIDHHPIPFSYLVGSDNIRAMYRPDVTECVIGHRSEMMAVAALCENQKPKVEGNIQAYRKMAVAMRRAAALGGKLPGEKLLSLLQHNHLSALASLADEPSSLHRSVRGWRVKDQMHSETLRQLNEMAEGLRAGHPSPSPVPWHNMEASTMSYDIDEAQDETTPRPTPGERVRPPSWHARDLRTIVTALDVAGLILSPDGGETFTNKDLMREAQDLVGPDVTLQEEDMDIVLKKQRFIKRSGGKLSMR